MAVAQAEIASLLVRLMGDNKLYLQSLNQADKATDQYVIDINGRMRDLKGRFVATGEAIRNDATRTQTVLRSLGIAASTTVAGLRNVGNQIGSALGSIQGRVLALAGVGSVSGLFLKSVNDASNAQESIAKFSAVFGKNTTEATRFVEEMANGIGRSTADIRQSMSAFQAYFVGLDFTNGKSLEMSQTLQKLTLDFAAFHNISDQEAMTRFISAMSGSAEVLDQFGVNIRQARIEEELHAMGITKSAHEATEAEKSLARLNVIYEAMGSQGAVGAAARESGNYASQLKSLKASVLDLSVAVGEELMPVAMDSIAWLKDLVKSGTDAAKSTGMNGLGGALATVADVFHTLNIGFQYVQAGVTSLIATAVSDIDRLVQAVLSVANKIPGIEIDSTFTTTMREEFERAENQQWAEADALMRGKTPSELMAERKMLAQEAKAEVEPIDREVTKLTMDAGNGWAESILAATETFTTGVLESGESFGKHVWWDMQRTMHEIGRLTPEPVKEVNMTAGSAVRFGSAESELSQRQSPDKNVEKAQLNTAANTKAQLEMQRAANGFLERIAEEAGNVVSIPW